jgi:(1->4)-alpha-D-glucan 1-alpha-D-glucosylmutase
MSELLDRLALRAGIVPEYEDIWHRSRRASDETKRALLRAMGLAVDTEDDLRRELAERESRPWRRMLPPVLVLRESASEIVVPLVLAERRLDERFEVSLECEDGRRLEQSLVPRTLPVEARAEVDGEASVRCRLTLAQRPGLGYHDLRVTDARGTTSPVLRLVIAPERCHLPAGLAGAARTWGPAVQLYALRSARNWGIGDLGDLARLVEGAAGAGAGVVGLNPLHALFPRNPRHASPYSPSSRALLNDLFLDVESIPDLDECELARGQVKDAAFQARLRTLRETPLVDHAGVAAAKREVLETLYAHFRREHLERDTPRGRAFREFQAARGELLESYGTFEALGAHLSAADPAAWGWPAWPERYRRPDLPAVREFAERHRERVELYQYLQWQCELQLAAASGLCRERGLAVGLYLDLAVSVDGAGFEAWRHQDVFARGARLGAPPDDFSMSGQDWGLPPLSPEALVEAAYRPFIECLRANMRHAGALRIDHVMGLMRAFWVPPGMPATAGAYVLYPFQDLLGILALESVRGRCLVVGEDLGTVPAEVREALAPLGVLSYRLLVFMKDAAGEFVSDTGSYPAQSLVAFSTHDLPTLAGYWRGRDVDVRSELGLFPEPGQREQQLGARAEERRRLLLALERTKLLPETIGLDPAAVPEMTPELVRAVHRFLARTPAKVLTFQLEDVLGQLDQVNLPGTVDVYPNWRRKLEADLDHLLADPRWVELVRVIREERG